MKSSILGLCLILCSLSHIYCFTVNHGSRGLVLVKPLIASSSSASASSALSLLLPGLKSTGTNHLKHVAGANAASTSTSLFQSSSKSDDVVIIDRDFRLAAIFLVAGLTIDVMVPYLGFGLGLFITALGFLFLVQTFRLSFVCDQTSFSLQNTAKQSGENIIVGGENKWTYKSFVNYDFFPKGWIDQPQGPILVYFKETQTRSDTWMDGPGASANSEEALAKGAVPGQVHFFPCIVNAKQLKAEWERRGCRKL